MTASEYLEDRLQTYLDAHHPGKSLVDIPPQEHIIARQLATLPLAFPKGVENISDAVADSVPDEQRAKVTLRFDRVESGIYAPHPNLIAYWPLDADVADHSGYEHPTELTRNGTQSFPRPGLLGKAGIFSKRRRAPT